MIRIFISLILIFFFQFGLAVSTDQTVNEFNSKFKEIVVDVRGSRGGNGDVAGGYLTVMDFIQNYQVKSSITILVDETSRKILERLAQGNTAFWSAVSVETIDSLPPIKIFDLYLALASPSGTFRYGNQLRERGKNEDVPQIEEAKKKINIKTEGVLIVQTVLGNTENPSSLNPHAVVRSNGVNYEMSPAGIAPNETGIYSDYIAVQLRAKTAAEVRQFVLTEAESIEDEFSRESVRQILRKNKLRGSSFGLAYGISAGATQTQFMSYLKGLAARSTDSFCLVTPSRFDESDIKDPELKGRVKIIASGQELPETAEPGKIYIVRAKTLPHKVFVGLMAYSMKAGLTPVGAGDGFMSAAINLGGPFALTRVSWNAKNIANLKARLIQVAAQFYPDPTQLISVKTIVENVFGKIDMRRAQDLKLLTPLFEAISRDIPDLSERIMNAAIKVSEQPDKNSTKFAEHCKDIADATLRKSVEVGGIAGKIRSTHEIMSLTKYALMEYTSAGGSKMDYFKLFLAGFEDSKPAELAKFLGKSNSALGSGSVQGNNAFQTEIYFHDFEHASPQQTIHTLPIEKWIKLFEKEANENHFNLKKIDPKSIGKYLKLTNEIIFLDQGMDVLANKNFSFNPVTPKEPNRHYKKMNLNDWLEYINGPLDGEPNKPNDKHAIEIHLNKCSNLFKH